MPTGTKRLNELGSNRARAQYGSPQDLLVELAASITLGLDSTGILWPSVDTSGRWPVAIMSAIFPAPTVVSGSHGSILGGSIGDWVTFTAVTVNGTNASLFSAFPATDQMWIAQAAMVSATCSATVATRTLTMDLNLGPDISAVNVNVPWRSSALTLTASEVGTIYAAQGGTVMLNDNGTISLDTIRSPFPVPFEAVAPLALQGRITTGQATDIVEISIIATRVA